MAKIKASQNKAVDVETKEIKVKETSGFIDTSSKEPTEVTLRKKLQELMQKLHVNQEKAKGLFEQVEIIRREGQELVGAIKYMQELLAELEQ